MSNSIGTYFAPTGGNTNGTSGWLASSGLPVSGVTINKYIDGNPLYGPTLGGGLKGYIPQPVVDQDNSSSYAKTRFTLREAWNTSTYSGQSCLNGNKNICTPFRAINNAGDLLSRENYSCGGTCQTFQSRPGLSGLRTHFGSVSLNCTPSVVWSISQLNRAVPSATCNVKFVYDSSDYTTYLKQKAVNKNYNDRSYGGNNASTSQSAIRAIKRY